MIAKTAKVIVLSLLIIFFAAGIILGICGIIEIKDATIAKKVSTSSIVFPALGAIFFLASLIIFVRGFRGIAEEERWIIEVFGKYYRTLSPGLRWLCPFVEKARTFVSVWVQRYPLFQKPVKIDFKDGSATPKEAYAFVQCRVAKNPNPDPTAADPDDPKAPYKMIYGAKDVKGETIALVENAVRSYLNGLTIDEGLPGGRGGYNILERLPEGDRNGVKGQLSNFGLRLLRITIGDFDLDRTVIDARESVMRAEKGAVAAEREMAKYSNSAMGVLIQMLADAQGMKREEIQKQIKKNSKLRKQLLEIARDLVERKIAIEGKGFSDIRVAEAGGMEKTLLELIALWQSGASPKEKPADKPNGKKKQKNKQDEGSNSDKNQENS